jgi:hypothetical protein
MKPGEAYMVGWNHGSWALDPDETAIPEKCLPAYTDGYEHGRSRRVVAGRVASGFDSLEQVNAKAYATWNLDNQHPTLPTPPSGSGCAFHYCWMPVDTKDDNHLCKAHGGKDCPMPKKKR